MILFFNLFVCVCVFLNIGVLIRHRPPGVKMGQAARFNDPTDKCKIMVATDAIGMGLNLNIRRIIFYSIRKISDKRYAKNI